MLEISVSLDKVSIDGTEFMHGAPPNAYVSVLGAPSRLLSPGPPAPVGHRNNQLHIYDGLGLYLNEHHLTRLIQSVVLELEPTEHTFPTSSPYSGGLSLCGIAVVRGMNERTFAGLASQLITKFSRHLGHSFYADGEQISIDVKTEAALTATRNRSRSKRFLSWVSIGFRDAYKTP